MLLSKKYKEKCINALIIASLIFFAVITLSLIVLLIQNGMIVIDTSELHNTDIILSVIILGGWIAFVLAVMFKVITIYSKVTDSSIEDNKG